MSDSRDRPCPNHFIECTAMSDYWRNHYNTQAERFAESPLKQVDRTINGKEMSQMQLDLTIDAVVQALGLQRADRVTDLCCGNGLITKAIAQQVQKVVAVDFSEKLVKYARQFNQARNIEYVVSDVSKLPSEFFEASNKIYIRDSISCLNSEGLSSLLRSIGRASNFEKLYIAGVPDADKLTVYYDSDEKMAFHRQREAAGMPHIGTWWSEGEMRALVEAQGLKVSFAAQNSELASAYYRFDCLIEKKDATSPRCFEA
jgi:SAM-dependent methyltransferase